MTDERADQGTEGDMTIMLDRESATDEHSGPEVTFEGGAEAVIGTSEF